MPERESEIIALGLNIVVLFPEDLQWKILALLVIIKVHFKFYPALQVDIINSTRVKNFLVTIAEFQKYRKSLTESTDVFGQASYFQVIYKGENTYKWI